MLEFIGVIAGTLLILAYIPQIRMTYRLKRADEISLGLFGTIAIGITLWVGYGLFTQNYLIFIMNLLLLSVNLTIVTMKITYDRRNNENKKRKK